MSRIDRESLVQKVTCTESILQETSLQEWLNYMQVVSCVMFCVAVIKI